ncbi:hypothetical protein HMSSN036_08990 [Paenibacillus macerans]|nr:hypothetical protein HMSSN036_08990 [Paenibacillus macerans]
MNRELELAVVRVTEMAALQSAPWIGRGDKISADDAATSAMRSTLDSLSIKGTVVIGEGEMDEAPMLYIGEKVGNWHGVEVDVAVDPLEGTSLVANGLSNALSVIAIAPKGNLLHAPDMYMEKLAVGPALAGKLSLLDPVEVTLAKAAETLGKKISDLSVMVLDRERHQTLIDTLRKCGVRINLLPDGDVAGAMAPAFRNGHRSLSRLGRRAGRRVGRCCAESFGRRIPGPVNAGRPGSIRALHLDGTCRPQSGIIDERSCGERRCHFCRNRHN